MADLAQMVKMAVEKNAEIPAVLDAYGQFLDSPLGDLEISNLEEVFSAILENLRSRYPQIASQRAASTAKQDISSFLGIANWNLERVKPLIKSEISKSNQTIVLSISERISRSTPEEKRAIDAILRLMRRSSFEIIFRSESGNLVSTSESELEKFLTSVRAESPQIRDLRFQNLIVEKGLFNKLILKSKNQDYSIWVPSFFARENVDTLIDRTGVTSDHALYSRLEEAKQRGRLDSMRIFLSILIKNSGVLPKGEKIPQELEDFVHPAGEKLIAVSPVDLDDLYAFFDDEEANRREKERIETEKLTQASSLETKVIAEEPQEVVEPVGHGGLEEVKAGEGQKADKIWLGKVVSMEQLVSSIAARKPSAEIASEVRVVGDYYLEPSIIGSNGISIVGSSGSGKSTTLRRLLDGMAEKGAGKIVVIDQKGEHRGIAWKYKWNVFSLAADSQSKLFRMPFLLKKSKPDDSGLTADLLQEWCLQAGLQCSDQQRARLESVIKSLEELSADSLVAAMGREPELEQITKKISRNLLDASVFARIFSQSEASLGFDANCIYDLSGRGLKHPTTKEERLLLSILLLKSIEEQKVQDTILVLEEILDRFKSESLKKNVLGIISRLREHGNSLIATSRSQVRDYTGNNCLEIVHRISGEKTINEEISGFKTGRGINQLGLVLQMLPRGYALSSETRAESGSMMQSAAIRVEPLQFSSAL